MIFGYKKPKVLRGRSGKDVALGYANDLIDLYIVGLVEPNC
jgi:hypothetical protein